MHTRNIFPIDYSWAVELKNGFSSSTFLSLHPIQASLNARQVGSRTGNWNHGSQLLYNNLDLLTLWQLYASLISAVYYVEHEQISYCMK